MVEQIERCIGLLLVMIGSVLSVIARLQLGDSWSALPQAKQLITIGLYSRLRNPMYVFHWFTTLGIVLVLQWKYLWWVLPAEAIVQFLRANAEAKVLLRKFGLDYIRYRKQVWF